MVWSVARHLPDTGGGDVMALAWMSASGTWSLVFIDNATALISTQQQVLLAFNK